MIRRKYVTHDELEARVMRAVEAACWGAGRGDAELEAQIRELLDADLSECPHVRRARARDALVERALHPMKARRKRTLTLI
jgi:hypothetical protein